MPKNQNHSLECLCPIQADDTENCCVALICNRDLIAEGISQGLETHDSIFLHDRFNDFQELLDSRQPPCYEVVLINARLIQYPLTDFFQQLQNKTPRAKIIVIATESDYLFQKSLMRAGVYGFLPMDTSLNELCDAILSVKSGKLWFDKRLLDEVVIDAMEIEHLIEQSIKKRIDLLKQEMTGRECDVFSLLLEGMSTREIANCIHVSEPTVKQHLTSLFKKFDVGNRSQLILSAFERVYPVNSMIKLFRHRLDSALTSHINHSA